MAETTRWTAERTIEAAIAEGRELSGSDLPSIDLTTMPLSYRGSWLNVSRVIGEGQTADLVHVVSHRGGLHPMFSIQPLLAGRAVAAAVRADAGRVTWQHSAGQAELIFADADTIRMRTDGLALEIRAADAVLSPFAGTYAFLDVDDAAVFTSYETGHRYRFAAISGRLELTGDQKLGEAARAVRLADRGEFELVEYRSGRPAAAAASWSEVAGSNRAGIRSFLDALAPAVHRDAEVSDAAAYLLWSSIVSPDGFVRRPSVLMSKHWMDKVWAWDPCFNALALAAGAPDLAVDQFLAMFDHQDATGGIPDSVSHSAVLFNFVKPPVHGWALTRLRRRLGRSLTEDELAAIYLRLSAWTEYWLHYRRAAGAELCHYEHGNDSGWDNATVFDAGGLVQTADLAAFLVLQLRALAGLAEELGHPADAPRWSTEADRMMAAMLAELWNGEQFVSRAARGGAVYSSRSLLTLMPLILGRELPEAVRRKLVAQAAAHRSPAGPSSEPTGSTSYASDGYWRGPVWAPATVLLVDGLRRCGATELAEEFADNFCRACEESGFAENFDARTRSGLRDRAYTWTAAGYLLLSSPADS